MEAPPDSPALRRRTVAGAAFAGLASLASLASIACMLLASCQPPPPACPHGDVCVKLDVVAPLRLTPEGMLGCPMYIAWGGDAGVAPVASSLTDIAPAAEGTLDLEVTRKSHTSGVSDGCCYHWYKSCPAKAE